MAAEVNRRNFLKTAALAAGPALVSARGANQKVNIGWIGVGTRGKIGRASCRERVLTGV